LGGRNGFGGFEDKKCLIAAILSYWSGLHLTNSFDEIFLESNDRGSWVSFSRVLGSSFADTYVIIEIFI
jgi:hypothetical protein